VNNKFKKRIEAEEVAVVAVDILEHDRKRNRAIMNSARRSIFRSEYKPVMKPFLGTGDSGKLPKGNLGHPQAGWNKYTGCMNRQTRRRLAREVTKERFRDHFRAPVNK